jgi:hypothetical protein
MHVFLLNIPRLEFAAFIPKGDIVTMCMLGDEIDNSLVNAFLDSPEVRKCMPPDWQAKKKTCQCLPNMNVGAARRPFADRLVFVGDCGVARLYKDGIGSAYRTAKAAATTAVFQGISAEDFHRHFWPTCRAIRRDNAFGRVVFAVAGLFQKIRFTRRTMLTMVRSEQSKDGARRHMSQILWDMFTGSATYLDIFRRTLLPAYVFRLLMSAAKSMLPHRRPVEQKEEGDG